MTKLHPEKIKVLEKSAEKLSQALPEKQREKFKADYVEVMTILNERITDRLDQFEADAVGIVSIMVPGQPGATVALINDYSNTIREHTEKLVGSLNEVSSGHVRSLVVGTMKDILGYYSEAITEHTVRQEKREGNKFQ